MPLHHPSRCQPRAAVVLTSHCVTVHLSGPFPVRGLWGAAYGMLQGVTDDDSLAADVQVGGGVRVIS